MENLNFLDKERIVIKVGTESISTMSYLDIIKLNKICSDIADIKNYCKQAKFAIVSSGAILSGKQVLQKSNGKDMPMEEKQIYAALGQHYLMHSWENAMLKHKSDNFHALQVLVDDDDFKNSKKFSNLSNFYNECMKTSYIPVFNENDTLATEEITFGDNDILASLVATKLKNDLLVILSTKDGIYKDKRVVPYAKSFKREDYDILEDSACGRGGIESKLKAAEICNNKGIPCIVSSANYRLYDILKGDAPRTVFINF